MKKLTAFILSLACLVSVLGFGTTSTIFANAAEEPSFTMTVNHWEMPNIVTNRNSHITKKDGNNATVAYYLKGMNHASRFIAEQGIDKQSIRNWLISSNGVLRFWVKAAYPGYENQIQLQLNIASEVNYGGYGATFNLTPDELWHEVRISVDQFNDRLQAFELTETDSGNLTCYTRLTCNGEADKGYLMFSQFEFYTDGLDGVDLDDGNIINPYKTLTASDNYSWAGSKEEKDISHPFFKKYYTVTKNSSGLSCVYGVSTSDAFSLLNDPDCQIRFWVKSDKTRKFQFRIMFEHNGSYPSGISDVISCGGTGDWEEIKISLFDFQQIIRSSVPAGETLNIFVSLTPIDGETFTDETDSFDIANTFQFINNKAYDLGDANRNNSIDITDLVRIKSVIDNPEAASEDISSGDIVLDNRCDSNDFSALRTRLLNDEWK